MVDKLVMDAVQIRRLQQKFNYSAGSIIAMDETAVWSDMLAETTVDKTGRKDIPLKSTGHEKVKVSVCLTAKADGIRLKPFIVFGGSMREYKSLNEEFKSKCVVMSSPNVWMNRFIDRFLFSRQLLSWDSSDCHTTGSVREVLKDFNVDTAIVPGGCTAYIQAPDVSWNKPFKLHVTDEYYKCLSSGIHQHTKSRNMKAPPRRIIVQWILDAWGNLSKELIMKLFKFCALNLSLDGCEDALIHCFKENSACSNGAKKLKEALQSLHDEYLEKNPFAEATDSDAEDACQPFHLLDINEEADDIKVL